jgi:integration host factor subunit beta
MTRSDLVDRLHGRFRTLLHDDARSAVSVVLDALTATLAAGDRVEIRGFGSFELAYRNPRIGRNPKSGEKVEVLEKYVPHFKAGKELRERVDFRERGTASTGTGLAAFHPPHF